MSSADPPANPPALASADTLDASALAAHPQGDGPELSRGDNVGRYIVVERIGAGGMGVVYAAVDPDLGRKVAIKVVSAGVGTHPTEGRSRLLREAQAMAQVSHPNVIAIYDVGTLGDHVFLAMELRNGLTLADWLAREKRAWRDVLTIFVQAGRGLEAAHAAGLVHRDFKPDNVHVGDDGRVCVLDFGLARPAGHASPFSPDPSPAALGASPRLQTPLTVAGAIVGTPQYMAPEQYDRRPADARTDQFSFCVALHEALYGERPFEGSDLAGLSAAVQSGRIRPAPRDRDVPGRLRAAVLRGLRVRPEERFPSMNALLDAIDTDAIMRRRTTVGIVAVLVIGAAAIALTHRSDPASAPVCRGAGDKLAETWSAARADAIRVRFVASGLPFGRDTADRTIARLDAWGSRWSAVGKLAEPGTCRDARSLVDALPAPAGSEARIAEIERSIAQATALRAAGRYADATEPARAACSASEAFGYAPLQAEAHHIEGRVLEARDDPKAAEARFSDALRHALAGRKDELAARIAVDQVILLSRLAPRHADARVQAKLAAGLIARVSGDAKLSAELDTAEGSMLADEAKYPEAAARLEHALSVYERERDDPRLAAVANQLGRMHAMQGRSAEALPWFERVATLREQQLGPDHPQVGAILVNVGAMHMNLGHYAESTRVFERSLAILQPKLGPDHTTLGKLQNNIGLLLAKQGRFAEAIERHQRALAMVERLSGPESVDITASLINLAYAERSLGRYDDAIAHAQRALLIYEKVEGKDHPDVAYPATEIGEVWLARGRPADAIAPLARARAIREANEVDAAERGGTRFALARALWETGKGRAEAITLAARARDDYAGAERDNPLYAKERTEIESWLVAHPKP